LPVRAEMDLSSLLIIWFQEEPFPVPDEAISAQLRALDWNRLAADYER
jgi:hypothetical protein